MFHARHEGECGTCHGHIEPGDLVTYDGDRIIHVSEGTSFFSQQQLPDYVIDWEKFGEDPTG